MPRIPVRSLVFTFVLVAGALVYVPAASANHANPNDDVYAFGDAGFFGSTGGSSLNSPLVGMASTLNGKGYWLVGRDGGVFSYGNAKFYGSTGNMHLNMPVVGMTATPSGKGYWFVASDGGIFSYGDAHFYGSTGNLRLTKPVVGMASTRTGRGYWLVASDGGLFAFGDAHFYGSTGNIALRKPVVGMAPTPSGRGYWLVASDGGIFSFGDAHFYGSTGALALAQPITGMTANVLGNGYWLVARDGGIFAFGHAPFFGSMGATSLGGKAVVGIVRTPSGEGYWLVGSGSVGSPPATPPPSLPPSGKRTSFGDGTYRVGTDIAVARYHNTASEGCYWERLSGFGGSLSEIIANNFTSTRQIVSIAASDAGFHTSGCGTWVLDNVPLTASPTSVFGDGMYMVGRDLAAGRWRNSDSSHDCYWERLSGFGATLDQVIANNLSTSIQTVDIASTDLGFNAQDCGTWTKIG
jgi:hypothetical protein